MLPISLTFFLPFSLSTLNSYRLRVNKPELETLSLSLKNNTHTIVPVYASAFGRTFYFDSFEERNGSNTVGLSAVNKSFMQMCSYVYVHFVNSPPLLLPGNPLALYICIHTFGYAVCEPTPQSTVLNGNDPPPKQPPPPFQPRTHMPQVPASCSAVAVKTCSTSSLLLLSLTALVALGARIEPPEALLIACTHVRLPSALRRPKRMRKQQKNTDCGVRRHTRAHTCVHTQKTSDPSSQERSRHRGANARSTHNACIRRASEPFRQCVTQRHLHDPGTLRLY